MKRMFEYTKKEAIGGAIALTDNLFIYLNNIGVYEIIGMGRNHNYLKNSITHLN